MKIFQSFALFSILFTGAGNLCAQQVKDAVEVVPKIPAQKINKKCARLEPGKIVFFAVPDYPPEAKAARVAGTVAVNIKLSDTGTMPEIESAAGNKILQSAAIASAHKVKFTPTLCDGAPVPTLVSINYNFLLFIENRSYTTAARIEDFTDVDKNSEFYEAILDLTENYRIAFGYAGKKFYPEAPLTFGDFAHFLRLTLDLLSERAAASGKLPRREKLFFRHNPQNVKSASDIKKLDKKEPFADSVKTLLLTYDIAPLNEKKEFTGSAVIRQSEAIDVWTKIFGADAVPVNFTFETGDHIMTRGEFALFLQESLGVLTYKILP